MIKRNLAAAEMARALHSSKQHETPEKCEKQSGYIAKVYNQQVFRASEQLQQP